MNRLSIKSRITLLVGLCMLGIIGALIGFSVFNVQQLSRLATNSSTQSLKTGAEQYMAQVGLQQAAAVSERIGSTAGTGATLARQFMHLRATDQASERPHDATRRALVEAVRVETKASRAFFGMGVSFAPNAMDGDDKRFVAAGLLGNETGRFSFYQSDNAPSYAVPEKEILDDGTATTLWYNCPFKQAQACVTSPYAYTDSRGVSTLMTTVATPLTDNGQVRGVISIDISLDSLQTVVENTVRTLYDGHARIRIVSPDGVIAADSEDRARLGKHLDEVEPSQAKAVADALAKQQTAVVDDAERMRVVSTFTPVEGAKPWAVEIQAPLSVVLAPAFGLGDQLQRAKAQTITQQVSAGIVLAILALAIVWLLAASITRTVTRVALMLKAIASGDGDLTQRLRYARQDELGDLAGGFNRFLDKLQPVIAALSRGIGDTRCMADQAAKGASDARDGMQQQFREVDQVATASQEMSSTAHEVARNAALAAKSVGDVEQAMGEGSATIGSATASINALAHDLDSAMREVERLADTSDEIGAVLEVIRSVAEQTNLLALNAAIEAARAGESGRGFAVVADEVRHLAKRTQDSVSKIHDVIDRLQNGTNGVVQRIRDNHRQAAETVVRAGLAVSALGKIREGVEMISDMNLQIASAAEEQSSVSEEVNRNVAAIRDVTERLSAQADESARVGHALNELANTQQGLVSTFKV